MNRQTSHASTDDRVFPFIKRTADGPVMRQIDALPVVILVRALNKRDVDLRISIWTFVMTTLVRNKFISRGENPRFKDCGVFDLVWEMVVDDSIWIGDRSPGPPSFVKVDALARDRGCLSVCNEDYE
jgi:hypothetical protein